MASHALGEAGSPYLTGVISEDAFKSKFDNSTYSRCKILVSRPAACFNFPNPSSYFLDNSSILMNEHEKDFISMQNALYFSLGFELLGAVFFLLTALFVVADKAKAEEAERLEAGEK